MHFIILMFIQKSLFKLMAKAPALAEAARLLSQAASSLINQSSQPSTSRSTESSAVTNQLETSNRPARARDEFRRLFAPYNQANASTSRSVPLNGNIPNEEHLQIMQKHRKEENQ